MTRETKIGLIVGMGVIIFIGILVSDHLAQTQPNHSAQLRLRQVQPDPLIAQGQTPPGPLTGHQATRSTDDRSTQAVDRQWLAARRVEAERAHALTPPAGERNVDPMRAESTEERTERTERVESVDPPIRPVSPDVLEIRPPRREVIETPQRRDRVHHVQRGESLYSIAEKYYGDGNYWRTIVEANPGKVGANGSVRAGVRLVIANRGGTNPVAETPRVESPRVESTESSTVETAATDDPHYKEYAIQPGDVLSKLAQRFYGTARKTNALYELNRDRIDDPDSLVVGVKIRVPVQ